MIKIVKGLLEFEERVSQEEFETVGEFLDAYKAVDLESANFELLEDWREQPCSFSSVVELFGGNWLQAKLRKQLVAAGPNGLLLQEIDSSGYSLESQEFLDALALESKQLQDGRFIRDSKIYADTTEIIELLRDSPTPIDVPELIRRSNKPWKQAPLNNKLSIAYEAINVARGLYLHIEHLGLTRQDIKKVAAWGESLLHGVKCPINGNRLFQQYQWSDIGVPVQDAQQLVSMIAKHPDVKRLSNNLEVAHKDSLDESELSLAKQDPEIAAQWHPSKNGSVTPLDVRPNSFKQRWWQCPNGHEWQAMPVYRTRMIRSCPGCRRTSTES